MSKSQARSIAKKFAKELKADGYPLAGLYLFGSHAAGKADKWSDVDIAVVSLKRKGGLWANDSYLSRLSLRVDRRIEPHGFTAREFSDDLDPMVSEIKTTGIRVA